MSLRHSLLTLWLIGLLLGLIGIGSGPTDQFGYGPRVVGVEGALFQPQAPLTTFPYVQPPPLLRDPYRWPFASDSIWNTPISSRTRYLPTQFAECSSDKNVYPGPLQAWMGMPQLDIQMIVLTPTAPIIQVNWSSAGWNSSANRCNPTYNWPSWINPLMAQVPIPDSYVVPNGNGNACASFLSADGRTILQMEPFARCVAGGPATSIATWPAVDLYGDGRAGAHGGAGTSAFGGSIRLNELRPQGPMMRHVIQIIIYAEQVLYPCKRKKDCFRWPGVTCDSYALDIYGLENPHPNPALKMGALIAIPRTIDLLTLGLETEAAQMLAWTTQQFGMIICDDANGAQFGLEVETGPDGGIDFQFLTDWGTSLVGTVINNRPWTRDLQKIVRALAIVDSITPLAVGGGGRALQPPAPPFAWSGLATNSNDMAVAIAHVSAGFSSSATPTSFIPRNQTFLRPSTINIGGSIGFVGITNQTFVVGNNTNLPGLGLNITGTFDQPMNLTLVVGLAAGSSRDINGLGQVYSGRLEDESLVPTMSVQVNGGAPVPIYSGASIIYVVSPGSYNSLILPLNFSFYYPLVNQPNVTYVLSLQFQSTYQLISTNEFYFDGAIINIPTPVTRLDQQPLSNDATLLSLVSTSPGPIALQPVWNSTSSKLGLNLNTLYFIDLTIKEVSHGKNYQRNGRFFDLQLQTTSPYATSIDVNCTFNPPLTNPADYSTFCPSSLFGHQLRTSPDGQGGSVPLSLIRSQARFLCQYNGTTKVDVTVTAEDGVTKKTYHTIASMMDYNIYTESAQYPFAPTHIYQTTRNATGGQVYTPLGEFPGINFVMLSVVYIAPTTQAWNLSVIHAVNSHAIVEYAYSQSESSDATIQSHTFLSCSRSIVHQGDALPNVTQSWQPTRYWFTEWTIPPPTNTMIPGDIWYLTIRTKDWQGATNPNKTYSVFQLRFGTVINVTFTTSNGLPVDMTPPYNPLYPQTIYTLSQQGSSCFSQDLFFSFNSSGLHNLTSGVTAQPLQLILGLNQSTIMYSTDAPLNIFPVGPFVQRRHTLQFELGSYYTPTFVFGTCLDLTTLVVKGNSSNITYLNQLPTSYSLGTYFNQNPSLPIEMPRANSRPHRYNREDNYLWMLGPVGTPYVGTNIMSGINTGGYNTNMTILFDPTKDTAFQLSTQCLQVGSMVNISINKILTSSVTCGLPAVLNLTSTIKSSPTSLIFVNLVSVTNSLVKYTITFMPTYLNSRPPIFGGLRFSGRIPMPVLPKLKGRLEPGPINLPVWDASANAPKYLDVVVDSSSTDVSIQLLDLSIQVNFSVQSVSSVHAVQIGNATVWSPITTSTCTLNCYHSNSWQMNTNYNSSHSQTNKLVIPNNYQSGSWLSLTTLQLESAFHSWNSTNYLELTIQPTLPGSVVMPRPYIIRVFTGSHFYNETITGQGTIGVITLTFNLSYSTLPYQPTFITHLIQDLYDSLIWTFPTLELEQFQVNEITPSLTNSSLTLVQFFITPLPYTHPLVSSGNAISDPVPMDLINNLQTQVNSLTTSNLMNGLFSPFILSMSIEADGGAIGGIKLPLPCQGSSLLYSSPVANGTCPLGTGSLSSNTSCVLSCVSGYTSLSGGNQSCLNGVWVGSLPVCMKMCPILTGSPTGAAAGNCTTTIDGNSGVCILGVATGYTLSTGSLTMTCSNGTYSSLPTFTPNPCFGSSLVSGGWLVSPMNYGSCPLGSSQLSSGSSCTFNCSSNYTSVSYGSISCSLGQWSGSVPQCSKQCPILTVPLGASPGNCTTIVDGNSGSCLLTVTSGYSLLTGSLTQVCTNGSYSIPPTFQPNPCTGSSLTYTAAITNGTCPSGTATLTSGSACQLACQTNYSSVNGLGQQTCSLGAWSGSLPVCRKQCSILTNLPIGSTAGNCTTAIDGNLGQCQLGVQTGYTLSTGSLTITCNNGSYSALPTFTPRSCNGSSLITQNWLVSPTFYGICPLGSNSITSGSSCSFNCTTNYTCVTCGSMTCSLGQWSGTVPQCMKMCSTLTGLPTGATAGNCTSAMDGNGGICQLGVQPGYTLATGSLTINCTNGTYSSLPTFAPPPSSSSSTGSSVSSSTGASSTSSGTSSTTVPSSSSTASSSSQTSQPSSSSSSSTAGAVPSSSGGSSSAIPVSSSSSSSSPSSSSSSSDGAMSATSSSTTPSSTGGSSAPSSSSSSTSTMPSSSTSSTGTSAPSSSSSSSTGSPTTSSTANPSSTSSSAGTPSSSSSTTSTSGGAATSTSSTGTTTTHSSSSSTAPSSSSAISSGTIASTATSSTGGSSSSSSTPKSSSSSTATPPSSSSSTSTGTNTGMTSASGAAIIGGSSTATTVDSSSTTTTSSVTSNSTYLILIIIGSIVGFGLLVLLGRYIHQASSNVTRIVKSYQNQDRPGEEMNHPQEGHEEEVNQHSNAIELGQSPTHRASTLVTSPTTADSAGVILAIPPPLMSQPMLSSQVVDSSSMLNESPSAPNSPSGSATSTGTIIEPMTPGQVPIVVNE